LQQEPAVISCPGRVSGTLYQKWDLTRCYRVQILCSFTTELVQDSE
jgi:hypothetical protein